jgi:energy-coupling factor transporter ATP-binding protein EcfA2
MDISRQADKTYTPIGLTDFRNEHTPFFIKDADRLRHVYAIGKTGAGKSTLLKNMAISDIQKGKGCCVIDPHGDIADNLLNYVSKERIQEVIYFNATDASHPIAFNPIHGISPQDRHIVAANLLQTFKRIWVDSWGPRLEYILHHCLLTLLCYPKATLLDIQPLLTNKVFREEILMYVHEVHLKTFWYSEYDKYPPTFRTEAISPVLNKMGMLISNPVLRNIVGQQGSINIWNIVDSGKILLCNFSKGALGEEVSSLLGSMLLSAIQQAALRRGIQPEANRNPFFCYVDEAHSYISSNAFESILSECRKFGLSLFLTHQYLEQLPEQTRSAIFGNVGTIISFQVGNNDAEQLAKEFHPLFKSSDFVNLPKYSMYLKLAIDGVSSRGFSAVALPAPLILQSCKNEILSHNQKLSLHKPVIRLPTPDAPQKPNQHTLF